MWAAMAHLADVCRSSLAAYIHCHNGKAPGSLVDENKRSQVSYMLSRSDRESHCLGLAAALSGPLHRSEDRYTQD